MENMKIDYSKDSNKNNKSIDSDYLNIEDKDESYSSQKNLLFDEKNDNNRKNIPEFASNTPVGRALQDNKNKELGDNSFNFY